MTYYEVTSIWHSNGEVTADITEIEADYQPKDIQKKGLSKDIYKEYFLKEYEAKAYMREITSSAS